MCCNIVTIRNSRLNWCQRKEGQRLTRTCIDAEAGEEPTTIKAKLELVSSKNHSQCAYHVELTLYIGATGPPIKAATERIKQETIFRWVSTWCEDIRSFRNNSPAEVAKIGRALSTVSSPTHSQIASHQRSWYPRHSTS